MLEKHDTTTRVSNNEGVLLTVVTKFTVVLMTCDVSDNDG